MDDIGTHGSKYVWAPREMFPERPICDCNERSASLSVTHHWFELDGRGHESCTVSLRFEKNKQWYDLQAYSLRSLEEVEAAIPRIIRAGRAVAQEPS